MQIELPLTIERQPDYTTCGPTSLHSVYRFLGDDIPLEQVIAETPKNPGGGTLNVHLAVHALRRGYQADIYAFGLQVLDPTWFQTPTDLPAKVRARFTARGALKDPKTALALESIDAYFALGGRYHWEELSPALITRFLRRRLPLLTGTNATYLYNCSRENEVGDADDVNGDALGHFVVVCGYDSKDRSVSIADPLQDNPAHGKSKYRVSIHRLIGAIFLGATSYDANFLVLSPGPKRRKAGAQRP
jgi:hypothetical protein